MPFEDRRFHHYDLNGYVNLCANADCDVLAVLSAVIALRAGPIGVYVWRSCLLYSDSPAINFQIASLKNHARLASQFVLAQKPDRKARPADADHRRFAAF